MMGKQNEIQNVRRSNIIVFGLVFIVCSIVSTCGRWPDESSELDRILSRNRHELNDHVTVNFAGEIISDAGGMFFTHSNLFHETFPILNTNYAYWEICDGIDTYRARMGFSHQLREKVGLATMQPVSLYLKVRGDSSIELTVYAFGSNELDDRLSGDDLPLWVTRVRPLD